MVWVQWEAPACRPPVTVMTSPVGLLEYKTTKSFPARCPPVTVMTSPVGLLENKAMKPFPARCPPVTVMNSPVGLLEIKATKPFPARCPPVTVMTSPVGLLEIKATKPFLVLQLHRWTHWPCFPCPPLPRRNNMGWLITARPTQSPDPHEIVITSTMCIPFRQTRVLRLNTLIGLRMSVAV